MTETILFHGERSRKWIILFYLNTNLSPSQLQRIYQIAIVSAVAVNKIVLTKGKKGRFVRKKIQHIVGSSNSFPFDIKLIQL